MQLVTDVYVVGSNPTVFIYIKAYLVCLIAWSCNITVIDRDKLLVKIDSNIFNNLCAARNNDHSRLKRDLGTIYLDKKVLYTILHENKEKLEQVNRQRYLDFSDLVQNIGNFGETSLHHTWSI